MCMKVLSTSVAQGLHYLLEEGNSSEVLCRHSDFCSFSTIFLIAYMFGILGKKSKVLMLLLIFLS